MQKENIEPLLTRVDSHDPVLVQHIDLNWVMRGVRHSYSGYKTLIKYSKKEHSLVSSVPSKHLYLGTPVSYGDINTDALARDESEGFFKEILNWNSRGSEGMEKRKTRIMRISPAVYDNLKYSQTRMLPNWYLLFCTCIDPLLNRKRLEQMRKSKPCYDFMAKIESTPTSFAEHLAIDVRKHLNTNSTIVFHGPVIYLDEKKASDFIIRSCEMTSIMNPPNHIVHPIHIVPLFVKDPMYEVQQEYRFVVCTPNYEYSKDHILLNVSDDLRKLFVPVEYFNSRLKPFL